MLTVLLIVEQIVIVSWTVLMNLMNRRLYVHVENIVQVYWLTRERQVLAAVAIFDFQASFWETQKW